jgi:hypothetical protein
MNTAVIYLKPILQILNTVHKKRVVVQNNSNLLLKIILQNTGTLKLFTINLIKYKMEIIDKR